MDELLWALTLARAHLRTMLHDLRVALTLGRLGTKLHVTVLLGLRGITCGLLGGRLREVPQLLHETVVVAPREPVGLREMERHEITGHEWVMGAGTVALLHRVRAVIHPLGVQDLPRASSLAALPEIVIHGNHGMAAIAGGIVLTLREVPHVRLGLQERTNLVGRKVGQNHVGNHLGETRGTCCCRKRKSNFFGRYISCERLSQARLR